MLCPFRSTKRTSNRLHVGLRRSKGIYEYWDTAIKIKHKFGQYQTMPLAYPAGIFPPAQCDLVVGNRKAINAVQYWA